MIETIYQEMVDIHKPENGQAHAAIHEAVVQFSKAKLKLTKSEIYDKSLITEDEEALLNIEDGFICDYPDKMLLLAKELKSFAANEKAEEIDPFIVGHLDLDTIDNFEFINGTEDTTGLNDNLNLDAMIKKSIQISKAAPRFQSKIRQEEKFKASYTGKDDKDNEAKERKLKQLRFTVQMPSLLFFYCNIVEILHIRENLIKAITETLYLSKLYQKQYKFMTDETLKLMFTDTINFDTSSITKEKPNYVNVIDYGKGNDLNQRFPVVEFDPTMASHLNFSHGQSFQILMTHLGVEELRAVLHYQLTQHQLLLISMDRNQTLMESSQKGLKELEFLAAKDDIKFVLPNNHIKLQSILAKNIEGYDATKLNHEKSEFKKNFKEEASMHAMTVMNSKGRYRSDVSKKYPIFMNKMTTSNHNIEGKLRILRSYRIKLLHQYCKKTLREAYQETVKTQLIKVCNEIRLKANLLPFTAKRELLFFCGSSNYFENLPLDLKANLKLNQDPVYNIDQYEEGEFKTMFYIPGTIEICTLDNKVTAEMKQELQYPSGAIEDINETDLEKSIKEHIVPKPTIVRHSKTVHNRALNNPDNGQIGSIVSCNFKEAYTYSGPTFNFLTYFTLVHNIFMIEYTICKMNSKGSNILNLENKVLNGQNFWKGMSFQSEREYGDENSDHDSEDEQNKRKQCISAEVIKRIVEERKKHSHLAGDLMDVKDRMKSIQQYIGTKGNSLDRLVKILINYHQYIYYCFVHGLERLQDKY